MKNLKLHLFAIVATLATTFAVSFAQTNYPNAPSAATASANQAAPVVGTTLSGSADDNTAPVKVGGKYNVTKPTFSDGQRGDLQIGSRGAANVQLIGPDQSSPASFFTSGGDGISNNSAGYVGYSLGILFNGTSFERLRSATIADNQPGTGLSASEAYAWNGITNDRMFTCPAGAIVNVTAAATTQIVAQNGSTAIRICSIVLTSTAPGTAQFVQGTGTNCGTGQAALTGAMTMATGVPINIGAGYGAVLRTSGTQALCLAATGGNVTGWIMFAQF